MKYLIKHKYEIKRKYKVMRPQCLEAGKLNKDKKIHMDGPNRTCNSIPLQNLL